MFVHRNIITNYSQQVVTFLEFIYYVLLLMGGETRLKHVERL